MILYLNIVTVYHTICRLLIIKNSCKVIQQYIQYIIVVSTQLYLFKN